MANYRNIHGVNIETVSSNPDNPANGQVWYNSTDQKLRANAQTTAGAWASGGNLNTGGIFGTSNGFGTESTGGVAGRLQEAGGSPGQKANTELYNGTSWTESGDLNTARNAAAVGGTYTSALHAGGHGNITAITESWNGSSWTEVSDLNQARGYFTGSIESNSAGIAYGGITPATSAGVAITESWNGSSWTEVSDLNNARRSNSGAGTSTNAVAMGGYTTTSVSFTEIWDGSSWTEVADNPSAGGGSAFGVYNNALWSQGQTTALWNGTAWSSTTSSSSPTSNRAGLGTVASGLKTGGEPPNAGVTATEEWAGAGANDIKEFDLS
tara:strand:- start:20 stop:994 length:975 start_codon:yes stop_codon:yes gene_type:complete